MTRLENVTRNGFHITPRLLENEQIDMLLEQLRMVEIHDAVKQKNGSVYGIRDLLNHVPSLKDFAQSDIIARLVAPFFPQAPRLVRAIYFDKTETANWIVPWHQDTTIATRDKIPGEGFEQWTVKTGIPHVKPPVDYLERMITLRIHLDDSTRDNGTIKVISGSHRHGFLSNQAVSDIAEKEPATICEAEKGSVMIMRPLLVHSSSAGINAEHRRVLHFEFSADTLPNGLEWYD